MEYKLPQYDLAIEKEFQINNDQVKNFLEISRNVDGFIWGSPVYHGSFSGILKNALDWQHFFLDKKIVGLISNGSNRGPQVCDALTLVARTQHATTLPTRICTNSEDYDQNKNIVSEGTKTRIDKFCNEFADYLERFKN